MKHEFWTIAYRRRQGDSTLLDDRTTPFHIIPNNWRYWYGDPHLICREGKTWVFAEGYDRIMRRGVISCCALTDEGTTPWRVVLRQPWHLSYPHLLQKDGEIYMIPESYVADEIVVFRAVEFPERWEKVRVLHRGGEAVDSTVFHFGDRRWLLSMLMDGGTNKLTLWPLPDEGLVGEGFCAKCGDANARPAGHLFRWGEMLVRPAQDCTESYGCALNFYEVTAVAEDGYAETLLCKLRPEDVVSNMSKTPQGLHTYNMTDEYEVIDFKTYEEDPLFWVMRPIWFIWRRVRKVLGR